MFLSCWKQVKVLVVVADEGVTHQQQDHFGGFIAATCDTNSFVGRIKFQAAVVARYNPGCGPKALDMGFHPVDSLLEAGLVLKQEFLLGFRQTIDAELAH